MASPSASRKSPALSRKSGASRKLSERSRKNEEQESVLSFRPSPRTRKLYRFKNHFSDGASEESDFEDWLLEEKYQRARKNGMILKRGGQNRINKLSMPEIIIQDYSDRDHKKIAKLKMSALSSISKGRGRSPEPVHSNRDSKAMAKLKIRAINGFNNGRGHHSPEPPRENRRKMGATRNKIFAVNSFRNGREITEYVEVSDSETENSEIEQLNEDEDEKINKKNDDHKQINENEDEKINKEVDDHKQLNKPKDDGSINIIQTNEVKEVHNIQMEETEKKDVNNTPALEVRKKIFSILMIKILF